MLVLSRRKNQRIRIGDGITLVICDVRGDKVRIGIEAPPHVRVDREEIYELIQRECRYAPADGESAESRETATAGVG